jgi:predicted RNA methylase
MASLAKIYDEEKLTGRIYTPDFVVCKILDDVGYNSHGILGKKIIDPACGDGRFLQEIVRRIMAFSADNNLVENLQCVYGWDIDENAVECCINNLNSLIYGKNIDIQWNICVKNSIKNYAKGGLFIENTRQKFDFIVGNPPYIRIQHLDLEQREYIQRNYDFCKNGSTDIYIAFYELCLNLLSINGVCGLITPNTFLYTETARTLRQYFAANKNLMQITNYADIQLFNDAVTYSAITIFNTRRNKKFLFQKALTINTFEQRMVDFAALQEPFWQLSTQETNMAHGRKLKELCDIHVGITTLCDGAYIFPIEEIDGGACVHAITKLRGRVRIERDILKPIVKGSRLKDSNEAIKEYILFPYNKINEKHTIIPEKELKMRFPMAYNYLLSVKAALDKRDNGKPNPVAWYAFGRSQGLDTSFGEKIIFSPMNYRPNFIYYQNPDATFYSGYCIKNKSMEVKHLIEQLNSERMERFVAMSSRDFRGGWKAYNKKVIENFEVAAQ